MSNVRLADSSFTPRVGVSWVDAPVNYLADLGVAPVTYNLPVGTGVPSGAVLEVPDVIEHPHTRHRRMVWEKDGCRNVGNPVKLSRTPARVHSKPKKFGRDTKAALAECGFSVIEIDELIAAGVALTEIKKA